MRGFYFAYEASHLALFCIAIIEMKLVAKRLNNRGNIYGEISTGTMLGITLIALAAIIGIGFGIFSLVIMYTKNKWEVWYERG